LKYINFTNLKLP